MDATAITKILIVAIVLVLLVGLIVFVFRSGRSIIARLGGILVAVIVGGGGAMITHYGPQRLINEVKTAVGNITNKDGGTSTNKSAPVADSKIASQLKKYTDASESGPTKNYYWQQGPAKFSPYMTNLAAGRVHFSADSQGRSGVASGKLTYKMFAASRGSRQGTPLDPDNGGWPQPNTKTAITYALTGRTYHGYAWNRSHSISDSLAGADSYTSANNFTAGTRSQNVGADQHGGMRKAEETAEGYWKEHPNTTNTIEYQVTPVYNGNERIPRGSIVDIKSSDNSINTEIVVINSAEGHVIDYNNGSFR